MTNLEVPTISFTHYLDLLKRRTLHVVTVSVLGLVIGGVVAMMIPRYYVASTTVIFNRPVLDAKLGTPDDPMALVVRNARHTVSRMVKNAVEELKWPEARSGSEEARRAYIAGVRKRVMVSDVGGQNRHRQIAELAIRYADTDGERSANLTNKVRDLWLENYVGGMKSRAREDLAELMVDIQRLRLARAAAAKLVANFEKENRLDPQLNPDPRSTDRELSTLSRKIGRLADAIEGEQSAIRDLQSQRLHAQEQLEGTTQNLPLSDGNRFGDPTLQRLWVRQMLMVKGLKEKMDILKPANRDFLPAKRRWEKAKANLAEMGTVVGGGTGPVTTRSNPEYQRLVDLLAELKRQLALRSAEFASLQARKAKLDKRFRELPVILAEYSELRRGLKLFDQREGKMNLEMVDKQGVMRLIRLEKPYEVQQDAIVPTRPTEPNPYLQALIGSIVGLAVAVGLVIGIDFMQMTFKSVTDVEAALGLPVLGSTSYLETEAEIFETRDRRAKMLLFTVVVLVLSLTVVTIYYIRPTSLPALVTDFLDIVLGDRK